MVYKPVEIKGSHLVDGGLPSTTNVDVAVEAGAKFVIVVNPLVPCVNDFQKDPDDVERPRAARARHGLPPNRLPGLQAARPPAHGIEVSENRVRKVVGTVAKNREKTAAWRRILEQTTGALLRQSDQA
jgi:predicted acylesterase/phospholipase RssA